MVNSSEKSKQRLKALAEVSGRHLKLPLLPKKHAEDLHLGQWPMSSHADQRNRAVYQPGTSPPDLIPRSKNPSAPKCPRSTFMQHYQVPSAEYSTYISHVISLGLAEDYIAQLRASCSSNSPPPLRAAIDQACRHLSGLVDDLQPVPASVHSLETLGQQNGAPVSDAAVGLAAAMPNTPEEEARILQLTQLINARHGAAKPHNTIQAGKNQLPSCGR